MQTHRKKKILGFLRTLESVFASLYAIQEGGLWNPLFPRPQSRAGWPGFIFVELVRRSRL